MDDQQAAGEVLFRMLQETAGEVAGVVRRQECDAPSPDRVDAIKVLAKLGERLPDFCRRAVLNEVTEDEWAVMGKSLGAALVACRSQAHVIIESTGGSELCGGMGGVREDDDAGDAG